MREEDLCTDSANGNSDDPILRSSLRVGHTSLALPYNVRINLARP